MEMNSILLLGDFGVAEFEYHYSNGLRGTWC